MAVPIYGSVITGFEGVASKEVHAAIKVPCTASRGNVRFHIEPAQLLELFELRSIDNVNAVLYDYTVEGLDKLNKQDALNLIRQEINKINWANGMKWWEIAKQKQLPNGIGALKNCMKHFIETGEYKPMIDNVPTFRVTCKRGGNKDAHSFTSMDAAKAFGSQLNSIFGWKADMKNFEIEIILNIWKDEILVMIALNDESLYKRNVIAFGPTTMRSTMCFCMISLAEPKQGDNILDPMCGGGSISIEGALAFPGTNFFGGDNHPFALERCQQNLSHNAEKLALSSIKFSTTTWDAAKLPFEDNFFNAIVTDMPFGKKIGSSADNRIIYPQLLMEWQRVVVPKGKAVLLTKEKRIIENILKSENTSWRMASYHMVNVGGLSVLCAVLINGK